MGHKKSGAEDGDDLAEEDTSADATAAGASAANPKAAFAKAKSKVLQKLSTQHLVSHTLPVVISLKHTLEASKSVLQVRKCAIFFLSRYVPPKIPITKLFVLFFFIVFCCIILSIRAL